MVAPINGPSVPQQAVGIEPATREVPASVSAFLQKSVATEPLSNRAATYALDAALFARKDIDAFLNKSTMSKASLMYASDAGTQYFLFRANPNVGGKVSPVFGFALTPGSEAVFIKGNVTSEGGFMTSLNSKSTLKLEPTGAVVDWREKGTLSRALGEAVIQANTK